jgi:hypothetical protein
MAHNDTRTALLPLLPALLLLLMQGSFAAPATALGRALSTSPALGALAMAEVRCEAGAKRQQSVEPGRGKPRDDQPVVRHPQAEPLRLPSGAGDCVRSRDGPLAHGPLMADAGRRTSER